jgi:hypothetical protein
MMNRRSSNFCVEIFRAHFFGRRHVGMRLVLESMVLVIMGICMIAVYFLLTVRISSIMREP